MPSRRQFLAACTAAATATVPGTATASTARPTADLDRALAVFGSGDPSGRVAPRALPRVGDAAAVVAEAAPEVADDVAGRLPQVPAGAFDGDDGLGAFSDAPLRAATANPSVDGVAALAVATDFTARGPVVRARVTGIDGAPTRAAALDALSSAGLPVAALDPLAVREGDDLALYAGVTDRDGEQSAVLALLLVVLAAVVGTFVLGLGDSARGGGASRARPPQIAFSFDYRSGGALTITHDGGDSVAADQLRIRGDGVNQAWGASGTVTAGDSVTVDVSSDATINVIWFSEDRDTSATLARWTGPDA
jgi:FlaG/FlaF family flagellin (archaellin)